MAQLLSVNVGHPREIAWRGKTVYTSVVWSEQLNTEAGARGEGKKRKDLLT